MKKEINNLKNPITEYYSQKYPKQKQKYPGIQSKMTPVPDCGEKSYFGHDRLTGRKALITGGDSGIGRAVAIAFAREGADVAISYLPSEQKDAEEVKKYIEEVGRKAVLIPGDLRSEEFCKKMVKTALKELDRIDIMALVAGKQVDQADIMDISNEQLISTFEVNVFSLFWTIKEALPHLPAGTSIITTSSIQAYQPSESLVDYASTKGAILCFTRALAKQIAQKGIRVNTVCPGPIWTALQVSGGRQQKEIPDFGKDTPYKRAGQPCELAGTYVFLASEESSYITAEAFGVTGGRHLA